MSEIKDITNDFGTLYHPISALVFYQTNGEDENSTYVEHFDMDKNGIPINAHPLTVLEAEELASALQTKEELNKAYLKPNGILSPHILHINSAGNGSVIWYSPVQKKQLFFVGGLGIPNGTAFVPPMIWMATKSSLSVFALLDDNRPTEKTPLYYAPFFNVNDNGEVCMGTVDIDIKNSTSLEEFITKWESYFFNSYFSHLLGDQSPTQSNCINVWKNLIGTELPFPIKELKKSNLTLKKLIS